MPKFMFLGYLAIACIANALQSPGKWDMFDLAASVMSICALIVAYYGKD